MTKSRDYVGVSKIPNGTWQFTVQKENGRLKSDAGYSTAKVAALMRDEYIIRHQLSAKRNFPVKRMARMRNEAYEQMFGKLE